ASDIDIALMDSLKVLDPEGPIREADVGRLPQHVRKVPNSEMARVVKSRYTANRRHIFYSILTGFLPDVLKPILVEKTREAAKCYRHQSLIASTVVAGSAFTLGSSRLSQS
ncbi:MAG: hypothetical protein WCF62_22620, partial [Pseudolabrys sp.]